MKSFLLKQVESKVNHLWEGEGEVAAIKKSIMNQLIQNKIDELIQLCDIHGEEELRLILNVTKGAYHGDQIGLLARNVGEFTEKTLLPDLMNKKAQLN